MPARRTPPHRADPRQHPGQAGSGGERGAHQTLQRVWPGLGEFDLIVNATSAARGGELPTLPRALVGRRTAAVDLSYGEAAIPFLAWARANGCHDAVDGLGMLVEQAAEAFFLWRGVRPDSAPVLAELRRLLAEG